jgi:predicted Zn-ribbon and HTH transcriptional regulator
MQSTFDDLRLKLTSMREIVPRSTVVVCRHCGYPWVPKVASPRQCPYCYEDNWDSGKRFSMGELKDLEKGFFDSILRGA